MFENEKTVYNGTHNGKHIRVWFEDYRRGDTNLIRVSIDNVIVLDENIQARF